ncbi:hypothetical protein [Sphingosinicella sp.]|uniref:hypothetical protein n=1 Tax=Sphingosinicella sp. TaxID=1917971 RepID=UPI00403785AE
MRSLMLSLLVAGQLVVASQPVLAAEIEANEQSRMGMFGGLQVHLPLGGARAERPRASLTLAPTMRSQRIDGAAATRVGRGLELSFTARRPEVRLAGTRLDRMDRFVAPNGRRANVSTLGWVGIGVGALALTLGGVYLWFEEAMECDPGEC